MNDTLSSVFTTDEFAFAQTSNGNYNLSIGNTDQAQAEVLISNEFNNWYPRISPFRDKLAYTSNRQIDYHIYITDHTGDKSTKLTNIGVDGYFNNGKGIAWSPAGNEIAFSSYGRLYVIDTSGANQRIIARAPEGRHFRQLDWSVQGKIVAELVGENRLNNELVLMNDDGTGQEIILYNLPGLIENPVFSPDGNRIIIVYDEALSSDSATDYENADIQLLDLSGQMIYNLSLNKPDNTIDIQPDFSPDGEKIIFVNAPADNQQNTSIYIMDQDGNNRELIQDFGIMPSW